MYEIGRLCVKIAGRDARKKCVIVDEVNEFTVLIDGQTRRRNCNIKHIEPLDKVLKIKKGASHQDVIDVLKAEGIEVTETKPKDKKDKPKKVKAPKKQATEKKEKSPRKAEPKAANKKESKPKEEKPKAEKPTEKKPKKAVE